MMTASYLPDAHERVQRDLIESEREQRRTAERIARELVQVLQELALLFDGARLESLRRLDPRCPQYWTAENWRQFFAQIPIPSKESGWGQAETSRVDELERTISELNKRLADAEGLPAASPIPSPDRPKEAASPETPGAPRPSLQVASVDIPAGMTPPVGRLLAESRKIWDRLPVTCPASFRSSLSGKGRTGEDLHKAYRRSWLSLYLIGTFGLNAALEIDDLLAMTGGLSSRAGSLGRILDELVEARLLLCETLRLDSPRTSLRLVKLSPEGRQLFQILFDHEPAASEWEHLSQPLEAERSREHSLAMLIFGMHARKRGFATEILPVSEAGQGRPYLSLLKEAERMEVWIEHGSKEIPPEWSRQAKRQEGNVAVCAATPEARKRWVEACKFAGLSGQATDLETLIKAKYGTITDRTPLWAERWSGCA